MSTSNATKQVRALASEILDGSAFGLADPIVHNGLSLVPIVQNEEVEVQDYVNAAEALEKGTLIISEIGDAVNTILARNVGELPVLIEEAEVLVADGSQDRIVVASVILQPGEESRIPVKCVHAPHGLRSGARFHAVGGSSVPLKAGLRRRKYQSIMTDVEHYRPETAVDQQEVWAEVERYCKSLGVEDTTKYTEALTKIQEKSKKMADEIKDALPDETCGFIALDVYGNVVAMEFYRNARALQQRTGVLESLVVAYCDTEKSAVVMDVAHSEAAQLLLHLKAAKQDEALAQEGSDNIVIAIHNLKGEAVLGETKEGLRKILYCSLGK